MPTLHLNLLGKPEVYLNDTLLAGFSTAKTEALLYYLAVTGRAHRRETLANLFWGEMDEATARRNLTKALSTLRTLLGHYLLAEPQSIALHFNPSVSLDIQTFEKGMESQDLAALREAAALYRGDFLEGFYVKDAVEFEEWMIVHREYLRERMMNGMERLINQAVDRGNYLDGTAFARRLLELDPWRETAHRKLMVLLARQGQYAAALAQYEKCRQTLWDELGVEPMPETRQLFERIQAARGLQLPPLPAETEPFVGRMTELARLREMLTNPQCRLVTVVGLGGVGKTHLALAAAREINREGALNFINGVVFIPLADVSNPADLLPAIAHRLDIALPAQGDPTRTLTGYLRNKEILLILDNFEHLTQRAALLTQLLREAPFLKILVTSREPLQLSIEWRLNLEGLSFPSEDNAPLHDFTGFDAVQLFLQTTRQVSPGYEWTPADAPAILQLCRLVAGMPLALKLAAARMRVASIQRIVVEVQHNLDILATQMRDLPPRQRSVRASFAYTWDLMNAQERAVNAALSVFRGGFTAQAARQIANADHLTLDGLIECGVVLINQAAEETRYTLHTLARQFGEEKLIENNLKENLQARHSAFYLSFLRVRADRLVGKAQQTALAEIGEEIENIRAAWRWAVLQNDVDAIRPVIRVFYDFHQIRSYFQEGEELFGWTTARFRDTAAPNEVLAQLLARWGALCLACNHYETAQNCLQTALSLSVDPLERIFVLSVLGRAAIIEGDRAKGEAFLNESYRLSQEQGDVCGMAEALQGLAHVAVEFGDFQRAKENASQSLALSQKLERPDWIASTLGHLAWAETCLGDYADAESHWREGLEISRQLGDSYGVAINLNFLGWVGWCTGGEKVAEAIPYFEQALSEYQARGYREKLVMGLGDMTLALLDLGERERALRAAREAVTLGREIESLHYLVYALYVLGAAALESGDLLGSRASLQESLLLAWKTQKADNFMSALYFYARLLLKEGEKDAARKIQNQTQAFEMLSVIVEHPSSWRVIRERASRLMGELGGEEHRIISFGVVENWYEWARGWMQDWGVIEGK
ncbi:MAG: BTAD domain-containing putative transcriptional regulator [Anaerolineales bacterium]